MTVPEGGCLVTLALAALALVILLVLGWLLTL
jgi:hypothetical protein